MNKVSQPSSDKLWNQSVTVAEEVLSEFEEVHASTFSEHRELMIEEHNNVYQKLVDKGLL